MAATVLGGPVDADAGEPPFSLSERRERLDAAERFTQAMYAGYLRRWWGKCWCQCIGPDIAEYMRQFGPIVGAFWPGLPAVFAMQ